MPDRAMTLQEMQELRQRRQPVGQPPERAASPEEPGFYWVLFVEPTWKYVRASAPDGYNLSAGHRDWTEPLRMWKIVELTAEGNYDTMGSEEGADWYDARSVPVKVGPRIEQPKGW